MKQRILSLLLALCLLVGLAPVVTAAEIASGSCGENLTWVLTEDGTLTITGVGTMDEYTSYVENNSAAWSKYANRIKTVVITSGVTSIGNAAFYECDSLCNVTIPNSVTDIGDKAFYGCDSLTDILIPASTTIIGAFAFSSCINLNEIIVDEGNPNYCSDNRGALLTKNMTTLLRVPGALTGDYAIPEGVELVDHSAFDGCTQITGVTVSATVTDLSAFIGYCVDSPDGIGYSIADVFASCTKLSRFNVAKGSHVYSSDARGTLYNYDRSELICVPVGTAGDYTISDGVSLVRDYAFLNCEQITSVAVPKSVIEFKDAVFMHCEQLKKVIFAGDMPTFTTFFWIPDYGVASYGSFGDITADIHYPANNQSWFEIPAENYGGTITWVAYTPNPFTDVPAGSWFEKPVLWALENGVTSGTSDTTFSPGNQCLRAHVVTFLWNAEKCPEPAATSSTFSDVPAGAWYEKPVLWAVENGITSGVSATKFGAGDVCSRYQVVFFLWKAAGSPEPKTTVNPFTDVNPGHFFYKAVLWAVENGITFGTSDTTFSPTQPCNRAQVVTFLYAAYN